MTKFGVYRGKDKAFAKRFADGGMVNPDTGKYDSRLTTDMPSPAEANRERDLAKHTGKIAAYAKGRFPADEVPNPDQD